jgi:D-alanyl-D-alanine carboxypeptidase/D-alanyl-D-alanine-endopeptidase (penicillin-binding protein 4)
MRFLPGLFLNRIGLICIGLICTGAEAIAQAIAEELPDRVQRVLTGHGISADQVSILVQAVDSDVPLLSHGADQPRNPASVMKLVTTWSALELLGPAYTWPTEVYFLEAFDGQTLYGDLGIKGYGDPFLVVEEVWKLLRSLRRVGLTDIEGDLVLDTSFFTVDDPDPGAFDAQPYRTYNVVPNALLGNFKAVRFQFFADTNNGRVNVVTDPALSNLTIRNRLRLVDGPCRGFQAGVSFNVGDPIEINRIVFEGDFGARCSGYGISRTVLQHEPYFYGMVDSLWGELGGRIGGGYRVEVIPEDADRVLTWRSPPLGEIVRSINKNSNNVMTRQLLLTLGAEGLEPPGTTAKGIEVVQALLAERGIADGSLVMKNGAGLSRDARVSARMLVDLLRAAYLSPYSHEFIASLSLAGLDGTTRGRFGADAGNGVMHVKTGRLDHVSALAGFAHGNDGRTWLLAIMVNADEAHRGPGQELEEAVMAWLHEQI